MLINLLFLLRYIKLHWFSTKYIFLLSEHLYQTQAIEAHEVEYFPSIIKNTVWFIIILFPYIF